MRKQHGCFKENKLLQVHVLFRLSAYQIPALYDKYKPLNVKLCVYLSYIPGQEKV
jgi:hypothetical protein